MSLPYLYSLQHCPYAIRARLALLLAKQSIEVRAVDLKNKPPEMLMVSKKGTVPILVLDEGNGGEIQVIDESLDIMLWALHQNDPDNLLYSHETDGLSNILSFITRYDIEFVSVLNKYKSASRYHDSSQLDYRAECEQFINELEQLLEQHTYIMGETASLADYALLPFIRQFAKVDRKWYLAAPYPKVRQWLNNRLQQPLFTKTMAKFPLWLDEHEAFLLGGHR